MRKMLAETLKEIAESDTNLIFLTGDLGFGVFDEYKEKFPRQYYNVGISEAALVGVGAGLSAKDFYPVVYSIASFMVARPFEQIKVLIGYNKFPMLIIGAGGGISYGMSGATHHACDEIGLISLVPGIEIAAPAGPKELREIIISSFKERKRLYVSIGKFGERDLENKIELTNGDYLIISTGRVSHEVITARESLLAEDIKTDFLHITYLTNLNHELDKLEMKKYKKIYVVEDHYSEGGIMSKVLIYLNERNIFKKVIHLGVPSEFISDFLTEQQIREKFEYDAKNIYQKIKNS